MANTAVKCKNSPQGGKAESGGFWYGYRRKSSTRSNYAVRENCRSLTLHPYTEAELERQRLFALSVSVVNAALLDTETHTKCVQAYSKQSQYATLRGYVTARVITNGGELPEDLTP